MTDHNTKTTFVGLKEFRRDVTKYAKLAKSGDTPVVVTSRNKPLFAITPLSEDVYSDSLLAAVQAAKADSVAGRIHTHEEMEAMLS